MDGSVLSRIVEAVGIEPHEAVLEVGPGRGALTRLLADRADQVLAVEIDRQLVPLLRREFAGRENVTIVEEDILRVDLHTLLPPREGGWKVAANLPYNISSQVLFLFLDHRELFSRLILMLQKEVGERLTAQPATKAYGILTVLCGLHYDISRQFIVRPGSFHPVPKVDSIVLRFDSLPVPRCDVGDEPFFRRVVKIGRASCRERV